MARKTETSEFDTPENKDITATLRYYMEDCEKAISNLKSAIGVLDTIMKCYPDNWRSKALKDEKLNMKNALKILKTHLK